MLIVGQKEVIDLFCRLKPIPGGVDEADAPPAQADNGGPALLQGSQLELVVYLISTGVIGFAGKSLPGLENAVFTTNQNVDAVNIQDSAQEITLTWKSDDGVVVEKTYKFLPDSYLIGFDVTIKNGSDRSIQDKLFVALRGPTPADTRMYGFEGPSALINEELEEIDIKDIAEKSTYTGNLKWIAMQDRYFMMSVIPDQVEEGASMRLFLKGDDLLEAQYVGLDGDIRPGEGYVREGGTTSYTRGGRLGDVAVLVTVIGEVPLNTARMVANSVTWAP